MLEKLKSLNIHQYACDLIDIRIEETNPVDITFYQKELYGYNEEKKLGAFISVKANDRWYYLATTDIDHLQDELHKLLRSAKVSTERQTDKTITYTQNVYDNITPQHTFYMTKEEKIAYLQRYRDIVENDELVISPYLMWDDRVHKKYYINSKGVVYSYNKAFSGIGCYYTLKQGDNIFSTGFGETFQTCERLDEAYQRFLADFAEAKLFINAPTVEAGKYPVVLSPEVAGVFAHESFGHKSEADFMIGDPAMKEEWVIGKQVASPIVSIVDYGAESTDTGYCPIDDEGNPTQKTYLIKDGILTGRLHSTETAQALEEAVTGNARAIDFTFEPIVRMTNTYFEKGNQTFDELLAPIKKGIFIKRYNHGSGMSTFTIAVNRAYKIENGKITDPVKVNVVTGTVFQALYDIDGLSSELVIHSSAVGGCGKFAQSPLHVAHGGPFVRIKSMDVS